MRIYPSTQLISQILLVIAPVEMLAGNLQKRQSIGRLLLSDEGWHLLALFNNFRNTKGWWSDLPGDRLSIFLGIILSRESFPAWQRDENWFSGGDDDPSALFSEASARWYVSWTKDDNSGKRLGIIHNPVDQELNLMNWIGFALESADHLSLSLLQRYGG